MHYPVSMHLRNCFVVDESTSDAHELNGVIRCPCGSDICSLLYVADLVKSNGVPHFKATERTDGFFFRIGARCGSRSQTHLIFDTDFHGWNGYVCPGHGARERERPDLALYH